MELLGPYLAHCHIGIGTSVTDGKDETGAVKWKWDFSDLREGIADIAQIIQDFKDVGYDGYLSLEDCGPGDDEDKIGQQGAYLEGLING